MPMYDNTLCHLKAFGLNIPTIATKTTKEVIALINNGLRKERTKKFKKVKMFDIHIGYTPKL